MSRPLTLTAGAAALALLAAPALAGAALATPTTTGTQAARPGPRPTAKVPTMSGTGGAVASVDETASAVGAQVLREGGNAVDAAVAMAATLGVTEPFSSGLGGGGYFMYYDARTKQVHTIDGRETAPKAFTSTTFTDGHGKALDFDTVVTSGLSVGVPGSPATWAAASASWGTRPLSRLLAPATQVARRGFTVDAYFNKLASQNAARFAKFPASAKLFLPGGKAPAVGSTFRNPDLARTYEAIARHGVSEMYTGGVGRDILKTANKPRTAPGVSVLASPMTARDLAVYQVRRPKPVTSTYHGLTITGMGGSSSGGTTTGEILQLMDAYAKKTGVSTAAADPTQYAHRFVEASSTAFADRNRWVGDGADVPRAALVSPEFAASRACLFDPAKAAPRPIPFGTPGQKGCSAATATGGQAHEGQSTTHLNAADKWGNVVSYTLTIEQTGGSGMTVPGRGFLLNNELTDFNFVPVTPGVPDPNLPGSGKRPRSSISPSIVLDHGKAVMSVGTPGGATIITSVAQILLGTLDRKLPLVDAIAAPRVSSQNKPQATTEPAFIASPEGQALAKMGDAFTSSEQIGNASGIRILPGGRFEAAAETTRGGGGSALVARPDRNR